MKLRPCPFCESYDVKLDSKKFRNQLYVSEITYILCDHCGAVISFRASEGKQDAVAMYNGLQAYTENEEIRYRKGLERFANVPKEMR